MSDATGLVQFMNAVAEISRGATSPSLLPLWQRHLLNARDPPRVTCSHPEFHIPKPNPPQSHPEPAQISHRSFFFGAPEISALRRSLPPRLRRCSTAELLAACLWQCRIKALQLAPTEEVFGILNVSVRSKLSPALPAGYYGNAFSFVAARATARELCGNSLGFALKLVKKAKEKVTEEYVNSLADLMVISGRPRFPVSQPYIISDVRYAGFQEVDFGWGKPIYGGVGYAFPPDASFLVSYKNSVSGKDGILVPVCLPKLAMERFVKELDNLLNKFGIKSAL